MTPTLYSIEIEELARRYGTDLASGLTGEQVLENHNKFGYNELAEKERPSPLKMLLGQFKDFLVYILIAALFISGIVLREYLDAAAIFIILILNAIMGFLQEHRAERAMAALRDLAAPTAMVIRDGFEHQIKALDLVPGDILALQPGTSIPADARLVSTLNLLVTEAALTGESEPSLKSTEVIHSENLSPGDIKNMVFMGTHVNTGHAKALVVATGPATEMGKIAELLQEVEEEKTPLQTELGSVGKRIGFICLIAAAIVFAAGLLRQFNVAEMLLASVSLAVAAVPEGLPAIVTIALALGLQAMARENAIIRKLHSVETLGSTTAICTDKTGTLTKNEMSVQRLLLGSTQELTIRDENDIVATEESKALLTIAALCNDARYGKDHAILGDPTEAALITAAGWGGIEVTALRAEASRLAELSFDSARKRMTTLHKSLDRWPDVFMTDSEYLAMAKGAPEIILSHCESILDKGRIVPITAETRASIINTNSRFAAEAYRTIALAYRGLNAPPASDQLEEMETGMVFAGLVGLSDPARPEAAEAIRLCRHANIKIFMVTGDHRNTAEAVARQVGLFAEGDEVMTGEELESITTAELSSRIDSIRVFARVAPAHKVKIVEALKGNGHVVAMTGDGVNDAPAVKRADIGIAMGITGTDVTKEASDMILADDNFATIVAAVREGRVIFDNIKKFVLFLLSCNVSEIGTMFVAMITGLPLPLLPIQILWINLITDGLPAIALGVDPAEPDVMERPPRTLKEGILSGSRQFQIAWHGIFIACGALGAFVAALTFSRETGHPQTVVFTTMVLTQLVHAFNFRARVKSIWSKHSLGNRFLGIAVVTSVLLQLSVLFVPALQPVFKTVVPSGTDVIIILAATLMPIVAIDLVHRISRRSYF